MVFLMAFLHSRISQAEPSASDECLVIQGDRMLARADTAVGVGLPVFSELAIWLGTTAVLSPLQLGLLEGRSLWLCAVEDAVSVAPTGFEWFDTRALLAVFSPSQQHAVSCGRELLWWQSRHRYCGHCGTPTVDAADERAKCCPSCGALFFPVISPAIIVAITRGDQLLLAHNRNFRPGLFSLLAGFVDAGETLEQTVLREVREEVGIEIGDLRYITSQPWAFPNSLMAGFRASYRSGEIAVDGKEIELAGWFSRDALPEIPRPGTVAHSLITRWLQE
jgi:NAD+ diphosphatase